MEITPSYDDFIVLIRKTEHTLNDFAQTHSAKLHNYHPIDIENLSFLVLRDACKDSPFNPNSVHRNQKQHFPDILVGQHYGVEVKSTKSNQWSSIGSSIVESTRTKGVQTIFMLFANLGATPAAFVCRPYEAVLSEITVTHSPRYLVDMRLSRGESIFDKMGLPYDQLRSSPDAIARVRQYYRSKMDPKMEMPWWLSGEDEQTPITLGMGMRTWDAVTSDEKDSFLALFLLLFPAEIVAQQYRSVALWAATTVSLLLYNTRDLFSAGGQGKSMRNKAGKTQALTHPIPHAHTLFVNRARDLELRLRDADFLNLLIVYASEINAPLIADGQTGTKIYARWLQQVAYLLKDIPFSRWVKDGTTVET